MNNIQELKQIIADAPEGATRVEISTQIKQTPYFSIADIRTIVEQAERIAELEEIKDGLHDRVFSVLSILGIYPDFGDIVCNGCDGIGKKVYANTSTYLKGIGGQAMTEDVCDECWGSGKSNAPFKNLRKLREQAKQSKSAINLELKQNLGNWKGGE